MKTIDCRPERFRKKEYPLPPNKYCSPKCRYWFYCNTERLDKILNEMAEEKEELKSRLIRRWKIGIGVEI
jgi:hypothetical protein